MSAHAVPRAYAAYCDATVAEMDGETRYRTMHPHRCTGEHGHTLGVVTHTCKCGAEFYFLEDMLELVVSKLREREEAHEVTGIGATERQFIGRDGRHFSEPFAEPGWPAQSG